MLRLFISVADWRFKQVSLGIDNAVIDAPPIDSNACDRPTELARPRAAVAQRKFNLSEYAIDIPAQMAVEAGGRIAKSADFFQKQFAWSEAHKRYTTAARAKIDRDVEGVAHSLYQLYSAHRRFQSPHPCSSGAGWHFFGRQRAALFYTIPTNVLISACLSDAFCCL